MSLFAELKRRNVIRVGIAYALIAWVVLQAADFGLDLVEAPNWVIQALFVLALVGLPAVLAFAWIFEMTPEGLKRESEIEPAESITAHTGRKLDRTIIAVLAVAVVYLLADKLFLEEALKGSSKDAPTSGVAAAPEEPATVAQSAAEGGETAPRKESVAVLPFMNLSDDPQNEYFSDGLTETLMHMLAQLPELQVAARTSSFAFKGQNRDVTEIAHALGVAHVLEGSVQKASVQVRVTAQLIRAQDGFHMWSQSYTRPLQDIFAIQDEIATDVADALGASLLGADGRQVDGVHTENLTAYDSYLKGLEQQAKFSYASLPVAENHFKTAIANDPGFTEARLALIRNHLLKSNTGLISPEEMLALNAPLLEQVRGEDPGNPLARAFELATEVRPRADLSGDQMRTIIDELRTLLADIPTETFIRQTVSNMLYRFFRDFQGAEEVLRAGLLIDPLDAGLHGTLGQVQREVGQLDAAEASLLRSLELEPGNPNTYHDLHDLEKQRNNLAQALDWARRSIEVDPQDHELAAQLAHDLYRLKLPEAGDFWLSRVKALAPASALARSVEVDRAWARGDTDRAIELAHAMLVDEVEDRQFAYSNALGTYVIEMIRADRSREAYDALTAIRPETSDYEQIAGDFRGIMMQWMSIGLMTDFEPFEKPQEAWRQVTAQFEAMGFPWRDPKNTSVTWDLLFAGQTDAAIEQYLEGPLSQPLAENPRVWDRSFEPLMRAVYGDPRVMARLAELEREYGALRDEVSTMLQRPEWNP